VSLLVRLQILECLEHILHKLILSSYEFLHLRVVVGIVGLVVAGLTICNTPSVTIAATVYLQYLINISTMVAIVKS
jgi:hypothetical protein